ncbi:unnamed protein product, partial [Closterium sp. Yama58-4]
GPPSGDSQFCCNVGATSGLGKEAATALASLGTFHVVIGCRSFKRGYQAAADIIRQHPHASIEVLPLDLSRPASVVRFCHLMRSRLGLDGMMIDAEEGIGKVGEKAESSLSFSKSNSGEEGGIGKVGGKAESSLSFLRSNSSEEGGIGKVGGKAESSLSFLRSNSGEEGGIGKVGGKAETQQQGSREGKEEEGDEGEEEEEEWEEEGEGFLWRQQQQQQQRQAVPSLMPPLCLLVNNAGILAPTASHRSAPVALPVDRMLATNYLGPVLLTLRLLPLMGRRPPSLQAQAHGEERTGSCGESEEGRRPPSLHAHAHGGKHTQACGQQQGAQGQEAKEGEVLKEWEERLECRIVNVTSFTHRSVRQLYVSDVASLAGGAAAPASSPTPLFYPAASIYQASKLCLLLFSQHLQRLLQSDPSTCHISMVPIDPGMVRTAVLRELPSFLAATVNTIFSLLGLCLLPRALVPLFLRAATAPQEQVAGKYLFGTQATPLLPSRLARDTFLSNTLWRTTQDLLGQWVSR